MRGFDTINQTMILATSLSIIQNRKGGRGRHLWSVRYKFTRSALWAQKHIGPMLALRKPNLPIKMGNKFYDLGRFMALIWKRVDDIFVTGSIAI